MDVTASQYMGAPSSSASTESEVSPRWPKARTVGVPKSARLVLSARVQLRFEAVET